ncbi:pallilysin-related adhesin [Treponema pedis]|uniref:Pallilysin-related adhesin n=1 Tax=Treponema pedis TaxID=409322 RepID=A0A7S6WNT0_9SPIR|nr:pallilysin-related adhesin [Treponema pedis]QOW60554.1 pallilysin-related adhesin [Treponema pedis]
MFKRVLYALSFAGALILLASVIFFQMKRTNSVQETKPATKTIIPAASSKIDNQTGKNETDSNGADAKIFLELSNDEVFIDAITGDLNGDGVEDQIVAVKKLLDPFLYLIISIQDPIMQKCSRIEEIRTPITQPKSLTFYIMEPDNSAPAILYSGMTSDNGQSFSIQKINKDKDGVFFFTQIADIHADIQILLQELKGQNIYEEGFAAYRILAYNSDSSAPNTLNQIQTEYVWNNKTNMFEKGREQKIPGEKIESTLLRKLQTGNMESFIDFLSQLWYQSENGKNSGRSIYLDKNDNNIIFNFDNIEEIYEIKTTLPRRYGLFFTANNKSIPNIIRRVDIEIKGVDEIQIRVIEDVARIKFGTSSLWNGTYKKNTNLLHYTNTNKQDKVEKIRKKLEQPESKWETQNGQTISFTGNKYTLTKDGKDSSGYFNIIEIENKTVLQMKTSESINKFYLINLEEKNKKQILTLIKIKLNINEIIPTGDEPSVFVKDAE